MLTILLFLFLLSVLASVEGVHDRQSLRTEDNGQHSACHVSSMSGQSINKSKRVRTSFKHQQLRTMKQYFLINQNPDAKDLKGLSTKTGLSKRVLQVRLKFELGPAFPLLIEY